MHLLYLNRHLLLSLIFALNIFSAFAQNKIADYKIKGIVIDSASQKAIEYATINLKSDANAPVKSILTKTDGRRVVSSNIVAEIVLVKGSEYKQESDFTKGWIPIAIVRRPAKWFVPVPYPKLHLPASDTSWISGNRSARPAKRAVASIRARPAPTPC